MIILVSAILSLFYGGAIVKHKLEHDEAVHKRRVTTKTNLEMQKAVEKAFEDKYKKALSVVDSAVTDIYDFLSNLFRKAGLEIPSFRSKSRFIDEVKWEKVSLGEYSHFADYVDYARFNLSLYDRIMSVDYLKYFYAELILQETKRAMWKRGYNYAYGGKDSSWQELEKHKTKEEEGKQKYPWNH